jgi:hypothetical protein
VRVFLAHLNLAPGPDIPAPPPARPHRRHPVTRGRPLTGAARSPAAPSHQGRGLPHSRRP